MAKICLILIIFSNLLCSVALAETEKNAKSTSILQIVSNIAEGINFDEKNPIPAIAKELKCSENDTKIILERDNDLAGRTWYVSCGKKLYDCNYHIYPVITQGVQCLSIEYVAPKIHSGMNKDQVKKLIGEPLKINTFPLNEQWVYPDLLVHFDKDTVENVVNIKQ